MVGLLPSSRFETSQPGRAVALITTLLTNTGLLFIGLQHYGRSLASERKAVEALVGAYSELAVVQEESVSRAGLAERLVVVGELIVGARERAELLDRVCTELSALPVLRRVWVTDRDGAYAGGLGGEEAAPLDAGVVEAWRAESGGAGVVRIDEAGCARGSAVWVQLKVEGEERFLWAEAPPGTKIGGPGRTFLETAASLIAAGMSRLYAEEQLIRTQRMDMVNQFGAGIAHDLNNLLMAITTGTELVAMKVGADDDAVVDHLETVKAAADAGAKLIGKLMSFARGAMAPPQKIEVGALLERMGPVFRSLMGDRIQLALALPADPVWVSADPVAMEQVVLNLVVNARDAIDHEGVVRVDLEAQLSGGEAKLTVSDDGRGMAPEVRARIFEAFYTTRRSEGGTGLGLTTVYSSVRAVGGRVEVTSEGGSGSRFEVYFPQAPPPPGTVLSDGTTPAGGIEGNGHVLLVEDDPRVRRTVRSVLEQAGYTVDEAADGVVATELLEGLQPMPAVILSDVVMPRMGGMDLFRHLRASAVEIPFVLMTGYAPDADMPSAEDGVRLLAKPFSNDVLLQAIRAAVGRVTPPRR